MYSAKTDREKNMLFAAFWRMQSRANIGSTQNFAAPHEYHWLFMYKRHCGGGEARGGTPVVWALVSYPWCSGRWRRGRRWGPWGTVGHVDEDSAQAPRTTCGRYRQRRARRSRWPYSRWSRSHVSRTCPVADGRSAPRRRRPADPLGTSRWTPRTGSTRYSLRTYVIIHHHRHHKRGLQQTTAGKSGTVDTF